jgi:hypothetical protein
MSGSVHPAVSNAVLPGNLHAVVLSNGWSHVQHTVMLAGCWRGYALVTMRALRAHMHMPCGLVHVPSPILLGLQQLSSYAGTAGYRCHSSS